MEELLTTNKTPKLQNKLLKNPVLWLLVGLVIGILGFIGVRMAQAKNPYIHYHANFAVWVNGQQDVFKGPGFYEEETACNVSNGNDVKSRVHMHDNVNHVIHVHANGVTWSSFFNNLGYTLGDTVLVTENGTYVDGQDGNHLTFILNGQKTASITNAVIKSEDTLLIDYGQDSATTQQQHYAAIPKDAHHYNVTKDPAACSGSKSFSLKARLKDALGLQQLYSD